MCIIIIRGTVRLGAIQIDIYIYFHIYYIYFAQTSLRECMRCLWEHTTISWSMLHLRDFLLNTALKFCILNLTDAFTLFICVLFSD